jgi:hypothetical protein
VIEVAAILRSDKLWRSFVGGWGMSRTVTRQAAALAMARDRRRALDRDRDEQDRKGEEATATVLVALDHRVAAQLSLDEATAGVGHALTALTRLDVSVDRAAALVELSVTEVRRLVRIGGATGADRKTGAASPEREEGSGVAASRAG